MSVKIVPLDKIKLSNEKVRKDIEHIVKNIEKGMPVICKDDKLIDTYLICEMYSSKVFLSLDKWDPSFNLDRLFFNGFKIEQPDKLEIEDAKDVPKLCKVYSQKVFLSLDRWDSEFNLDRLFFSGFKTEQPDKLEIEDAKNVPLLTKDDYLMQFDYLLKFPDSDMVGIGIVDDKKLEHENFENIVIDYKRQKN